MTRFPAGSRNGGGEYLLIHCLDEIVEPSPADDCDVPGSPAARQQRAWDAELEARGAKLAGGRLQPARRPVWSACVKGGVLVTDRPFAETKEQVAGLNVLACPSLAGAVEIASRHPTTRIGTFEVRPLAQG